ncbi:MAG: ribokinase, partial [Clostridia bacterium]
MKTVYVIGSINMDLVIRTARMVEEGETISGNEFMTNAGGKGANQAVAVAKMGGRVHMVGNVGKLAFSQELIESLKKYGVNVDFVQSVEEISSGIAMIIVTENDNRIIIDSGANYTLTKADVDKALERAQEGDYLLTQMEILTEITEYALEMGKAKGMVTIFNPAPYKEISENAFKGLEYIIPNQKECEALTGIYPIDEISFKKASFILREKGVKKVIVTMGKKGSMYDDGSF